MLARIKGINNTSLLDVHKQVLWYQTTQLLTHEVHNSRQRWWSFKIFITTIQIHTHMLQFSGTCKQDEQLCST